MLPLIEITQKSSSADLCLNADIQGLCVFCEVGGGIIGGASAIAMLVGVNPLLLGIPVIGPALVCDSAKGMILMAGLNVGVQAQVGVASFWGYLN